MISAIQRATLFIKGAATVALALIVSACDPSSDTTPVAFSTSSYSAAQSAGAVTLTVTRGGATSANTGSTTSSNSSAAAPLSVTYKTTNDTAVAGTDYTAMSGTLTWGENDTTTKTITVPVSNKTPFGGNKSFDVVLTDPSADAVIGNPGSASVTIAGDATPPAPGDVGLSESTYTVAQSAGSLTVTVNRTGGSSAAIGVGYATSNGTAVAGTDYTAASGTLQWAEGDSSAKTFSIAISNATQFTGNKTLTVALVNPSGGASLTSTSDATVTITGGAAAPVGSLQFAAPSYPIAQNGSNVTLSVDRVGGSSGAISASYATANGTAAAGATYSAASGTLQWADGDSQPKTVTIPVSNIVPFTGSETFTVALSKPSAGATISNPGTATVTIAGDAAPPVGSVALSSATYTAAQGSASLLVSVSRTGGSAGAIGVSYATANGTAVAGTDYTAASGKLQWAAGETTAQTLSIPISNATPFTGSKSFSVALSAATGGAAIASPSSATVNITGDAVAAVGNLQIAASTYTVAQSAGSLPITVNRTGGSNGAITVAYATANGTATAGTTYTATSGTLQWASGDASSKTITVPISNATPFSGTESFTVALSSPSGGAAVSTPASATVSISGSSPAGSGSSGGSGTGPSAVTNLQVINQGGPNNGTAALTNYQQISWSAATAGSNPIDHYQVYRNGSAYATTTGTTYTDSNAPNSNSPSWSVPATTYSYQVAAVDTKGNIGPQAAQMSVYAYQNGVSNWDNNDLSYGNVPENYSSTAGNPQGSSFDLSVDFINGGFQPTSHMPQVPVDDLELGAFNYFVIDINPGPTVNYTLRLSMITRLPPGDVYPWSAVNDVFQYGPAPQPNTWATYKVPLSALTMGFCNFTGSISGTTLTVSSVQSAAAIVDAGGFVTGNGVPAGTYITAFGQNGSVGTFTVAGPGISSSTSVPSTSMVYQRTPLYKFDIYPNVPAQVYFNNIGFTAN